MKMKPAERNALKSKAAQTAREISRLEASLAKYNPGTLPHKRLSADLEEKRIQLRETTSNLARTTQPNPKEAGEGHGTRNR